MGKNAKEEKPIYERPKLVELDTSSASGNTSQCIGGSMDSPTNQTLLGPSPGPKSA